MLLTNGAMADYTGSELYVRDVALELLQRGHEPVVYSPRIGKLADELLSAGVHVVEELDSPRLTPSIIHGQHYLETMAAVSLFPNVPAIYFCHGVKPWDEMAPQHPSILRYVAVSDVVRDWLVTRRHIDPSDIATILNFVDLRRFRSRSRLPDVPRRALALSNQITTRHLGPILHEACRRNGMSLEIVGMANDNPTSRPEDLLGHYDIVFARGRAALEAIAVGAAVVCCDAEGLGPMVTSENLEWLRRHNLGFRVLNKTLTVAGVSEEIARYDAAEARRVSETLRETVGLDIAVDRILDEYRRTRHMWETGYRRTVTDDGRPFVWLSKVVRNEQMILSQQRRELQERLDRTMAWRIRRRLLSTYPAYVLGRRLVGWARHAHRVFRLETSLRGSRAPGLGGASVERFSRVSPRHAPPDGCPWMACIVLSVGGQPGLVEAVRSLYVQSEPAEIVVVNSGGGNPQETLRRAGLEVTVIDHEESLSPGAARNVGIRSSQAPYVAFLAADCVAGPGWIEERLRHHRAGYLAVGTAVVNRDSGNLAAWASHMTRFSRSMPSTPAGKAVPCDISYAREVFTYFGLFRPDLTTGEDSEFSERLVGEIPVNWAPTAYTRCSHPTTLKRLLSDSFLRGAQRAASSMRSNRRCRRCLLALHAIYSLPSLASGVRSLENPSDRRRASLAMPLMLPAIALYACGVFFPGRSSAPQSRSERTEKPKVLALLVFRNEMRFLPGYFENVSNLVDGIIALDDGSTDGSGDFVKRQPTLLHLITLPNEEPHHWNEPLIHALCIQAALEHGADWCIALDADERLEAGFRDRAAIEIERAERGGYMAYAVRFRELWDSAETYRVDGLWGRKVQARFFKARYDYRIHVQELHGHWAPINSMNGGGYPQADLNIYHLRMIRKEDRPARRDRYKMIDPDNKWQPIGYDYLTDEEGLQLERIPPDRLYEPIPPV